MMLKPIIDIVAKLNVGSDILKEFIDRVYSGKKIIKHENGTTETVTIEDAEDATVEGTPINRESLMAIQGFVATRTYPPTKNEFGEEQIIQINTETNERLIFTFKLNGQIEEKLIGEKIITKTITFNADGSILEVIS